MKKIIKRIFSSPNNQSNNDLDKRLKNIEEIVTEIRDNQRLKHDREQRETLREFTSKIESQK